MNYLESLVKNSFDKIPEEFKNRIDDYEIILDNNGKNSQGIILNYQYLENKLQETIDKIVIQSISMRYGFTEEEANRLLECLRQGY